MLLTGIINALKAVANGIMTIVDLVIWLVQEISTLVTTVTSALANAVTIVTNFLPTPLLAGVLSLLTIAVIYKIMGREG